MIVREIDPVRINRVSNLPEVKPFVCYLDGPMDWASAFPCRHSGIVILSNQDDALGVFAMTGDREWQIHTIFGPNCRGRQAVRVGLDMLSYMERYADRFWGATPLHNKAARWFNRQVGFSVIGTDEYEVEGPVEIVEKRYNQA